MASLLPWPGCSSLPEPPSSKNQGDRQGDACDEDDDNDFVPDADEQRIYESAGFADEQLVPCASTTDPDPWALDIIGLNASDPPDKVVDTGDVLFFLAYTSSTDASFSQRVNIDASSGSETVVDIGDILLDLGFMGFSCSPP